jgi:hypothetical protein
VKEPQSGAMTDEALQQLRPRFNSLYAKTGRPSIAPEKSALVDKAAAARQAQWLEKVLADEHERDREHSDRIQLPD